MTMHVEGNGSSKEKALRGLFVAGLVDVCLTTTAFLLSNSSVLLADFLKTGIEFIAITLSWVAIRRINRGGGKTYEYGLGKLENISSLFVALVMLLSFLIITANAVRRGTTLLFVGDGERRAEHHHPGAYRRHRSLGEYRSADYLFRNQWDALPEKPPSLP